MPWIISLPVLLFVILFLPTYGYSQTPSGTASQKMVFKGHPPAGPVEVVGNSWTIYATGVIDIDAPARLKAYLDKNKIPEKSILAFDSPGGSLLGGMKLGQVIRDAGLFTYVGRENWDPHGLLLPGECHSACALAFLGGKFRWVNEKSQYGVHRFTFAGTGSPDTEVTQILSASIVQFIRDMGADVALFNAMTSASSNSIRILSASQLKAWRVVNSGYETTTWTIETADNALYLKGSRETWRGVNKFMLVCPSKKPMFLYAIFDPEGRASEVLEMKSYSLFIGNKAIPISRHLIGKPFELNGWINVMFRLDRQLLTALSKAAEVGIAFQYSYEAPVFAGFSNLDFSEGAKKLPAIIPNCPVP